MGLPTDHSSPGLQSHSAAPEKQIHSASARPRALGEHSLAERKASALASREVRGPTPEGAGCMPCCTGAMSWNSPHRTRGLWSLYTAEDDCNQGAAWLPNVQLPASALRQGQCECMALRGWARQCQVPAQHLRHLPSSSLAPGLGGVLDDGHKAEAGAHVVPNHVGALPHAVLAAHQHVARHLVPSMLQGSLGGAVVLQAALSSRCLDSKAAGGSKCSAPTAPRAAHAACPRGARPLTTTTTSEFASAAMPPGSRQPASGEWSSMTCDTSKGSRRKSRSAPVLKPHCGQGHNRWWVSPGAHATSQAWSCAALTGHLQPACTSTNPGELRARRSNPKSPPAGAAQTQGLPGRPAACSAAPSGTGTCARPAPPSGWGRCQQLCRDEG